MSKIHQFALAGAVLGAASITLSAVTPSAATDPTDAPRTVALPQDPDLNFAGKVEEIWVTALGYVQFRVRGTDENGKERLVWFDTPPDKDVNTLFENLTLELLRHAVEHQIVVNVHAKTSSGDDGSVAPKAFDVVRLGIRFD